MWVGTWGRQELRVGCKMAHTDEIECCCCFKASDVRRMCITSVLATPIRNTFVYGRYTGYCGSASCPGPHEPTHSGHAAGSASLTLACTVCTVQYGAVQYIRQNGTVHRPDPSPVEFRVRHAVHVHHVSSSVASSVWVLTRPSPAHRTPIGRPIGLHC